MLQYLELREEYSEFYNYVNAASPAALLTIESMSGGTAFLPNNDAMVEVDPEVLPNIEHQPSVDVFVLRHFCVTDSYSLAELGATATGTTASGETLRLGLDSVFNVNYALSIATDGSGWSGGVVHTVDAPFLTLLGGASGTWQVSGNGSSTTIFVESRSGVRNKALVVRHSGENTQSVVVRIFVDLNGDGDTEDPGEHYDVVIIPGSSFSCAGDVRKASVRRHDGTSGARGDFQWEDTP